MQKSNNHSVLELKLKSGINKRIFLESPVLSTYPNDRLWYRSRSQVQSERSEGMKVDVPANFLTVRKLMVLSQNGRSSEEKWTDVDQVKRNRR